MLNIDEILERLDRGEMLMIDDQWRSYISIEHDDDMPARFVARSISAHLEDAAIKNGHQHLLKYEEKRSASLTELLLSLMDWEWHKASDA